mgnify:CR=1 FL=1
MHLIIFGDLMEESIYQFAEKISKLFYWILHVMKKYWNCIKGV